MAQSDYELAAHISGLNQRTEINSIFDSILTHNSGSTAPIVTKAFMMWVDTSNATYYYLKMRNHDNTAWVALFIYTVSTKVITPFIINSPTTNAIPKINADGTIGNSNIINDANGNVGIGVTPSAWGSAEKSIDVGAFGSYALLYDGACALSWNGYENGSDSWKYKTNNPASMYRQNIDGSHTWRTAPSGTAGNAITWTNAMTLDSSGNLALNSGYLSGIYGAITSFGNASTNYFQMIPRNVANNDNVFSSAVGGVLKATILANGNFQSATNSYGSTSDAKLKENVVETSDKLDKLMNVRVVNFNYIGDDQKQIGVIAQEVEKIFPGIVYETKDTEQVEVTKTKEVTDEEGNVTTEEYTEIETQETGEVTKNVKYSVIYMMMLKGLQEMRAEYTAEINDLKARIEALESK